MNTPRKRTRNALPDAACNRQELDWWNANGVLMASVWDYDDLLSRLARGDYLKRAAAFLSQGRAATILEPGCGSGGIGRLIAGPALRVVGCDWSETMVALARERVAGSALAECCAYRVGAPDAKTLAGVDGVLLHAFLHHLDGKELRDMLKGLCEGLRPGTRLWVYEPAMFTEPPAKLSEPSDDARLHMELAEELLRSSVRFLRDRKLVDVGTYDRLVGLFEEANRQGWYLSPKEVPFDMDELGGVLAEYCTVHDSYWSTIKLYGWIVEPHLVVEPALRRLVLSALMPVLLEADARLAREEAWLRGFLVAPNHAFHVWECQVGS